MSEDAANLSGTAGAARPFAHHDVVLVIGVALVLTTLLIPLPTVLLDMLLACSLAISLATLVVVLSARESIEFSSFPSLLLLVTLFRLSLNVASTRLILSDGDAGRIIHTFGHFVTRGDLVIGLVVFLILVIIQFVVITKGAERISEVAARFNLDAMPGKQMAIDADLNAGLIGEEEARDRREKIVRESEFYGAMDGASKFIRGDAIAGLIITAVNLIGGFVVGMLHNLSAAQSVRTYSILAIGDGLVSQIPAVVISTASGFLISKTSSQRDLSQDLARQFMARSRPVTIASFLFGAMIFVPGFPKLPFAGLAIGTALLGRRLKRMEQQARHAKHKAEKSKAKTEDAPVEELLDVDRVAVHVGTRLIKTVDPRRQSSLSHRIGPLRRKFAEQYGFILPLIRLRDSMALEATGYEIRIHDHVVGRGTLEPDKLLAIDPGTVQKPVDGQPTAEPVFGLPALWIEPDIKEPAELAGYTVVEPESILVTHLSEMLQRHAGELLSRDDVQTLVDRLKERQPALVGTVGEGVPVGLLHRVLQNLLRDRLPIRDLAQVLETLADHASRTKDPATLTELARKALVRTITEVHTDPSGRVPAVVLAPPTEYGLRSAVRKEADGDGLELPPARAMDLCRRVADAWQEAMGQGRERTVLLCDARLRPHLANLLSRQVPQLPIVAYDEVAVGAKVDSVATVTLEPEEADALPATAS